jgi:DNA adenine methylase
MTLALDAPFPWFGGKRRVASIVWRAFGNVANYVEPFLGSGAVMLGRPQPFSGNETVNDLDGLVANFYRSIKHSPDETAAWADWPVNENDLHARHVWLLSQLHNLPARLEADPDWHDAKIAGWWVWGMACWIGCEFCSGKGPWQVVDGKLVHVGGNGRGISRQLVHLGNNGQGVKRQLVHLGNNGQGNRLIPWFQALSDRLARVRVCSGDWSRVCGPSVTFKHGLTAVFLDPPYADTADRDPTIYRQDSSSVAHDVREWAIESGKRSDMRIALCGYEGEHEMPASWSVYEWTAHGGMGLQGANEYTNKFRERIWFSPACLPFQDQLSLFDWPQNPQHPAAARA